MPWCPGYAVVSAGLMLVMSSVTSTPAIAQAESEPCVRSVSSFMSTVASLIGAYEVGKGEATQRKGLLGALVSGVSGGISNKLLERITRDCPLTLQLIAEGHEPQFESNAELDQFKGLLDSNPETQQTMEKVKIPSFRQWLSARIGG